MADPDPMTCDPGSRVYDPDPGTVIPDPIYLVTTLSFGVRRTAEHRMTPMTLEFSDIGLGNSVN